MFTPSSGSITRRSLPASVSRSGGREIDRGAAISGSTTGASSQVRQAQGGPDERFQAEGVERGTELPEDAAHQPQVDPADHLAVVARQRSERAVAQPDGRATTARWSAGSTW